MAPAFFPMVVRDVYVWEPGLFTLTLDGTIPFRAGQFCTVCLRADGGDRSSRRAYSIASAPGEPLQLLVVEVVDGRVSPYLSKLAPGDTLYVSPSGKGLFTLDDIPEGRDLWMIATGTGLAPYRSMIRDGTVFDRHLHVVLVYGARTPAQLAHLEELRARPEVEAGRLTVVTSTTRSAGGDLDVRVTEAFGTGALEQAAGRRLDPSRSHVLLCGNPEMIDQMLQLLADRTMLRHSRVNPGHVTTERYW